MTVPEIYGDFAGYQTARITTSGQVFTGQGIVKDVWIKCTTASIAEWYDDTGSSTSGNKHGGITGVANGWAHEVLNQRVSNLYVNFGSANVTEAIVNFVRA